MFFAKLRSLVGILARSSMSEINLLTAHWIDRDCIAEDTYFWMNSCKSNLFEPQLKGYVWRHCSLISCQSEQNYKSEFQYQASCT